MMNKEQLQARLQGLEQEMEYIEENPLFDYVEFAKFDPEGIIITDKDKLYIRYYGLRLKFDYYLEKLSLINYIDDKFNN